MLSGKRGLVFGVANKHSLAWAIAEAWRAHGADVAVVCQNERTRAAVEKGLAAAAMGRASDDDGGGGCDSVPSTPCTLVCDVAQDGDVAAAVAQASAALARNDALRRGSGSGSGSGGGGGGGIASIDSAVDGLGGGGRLDMVAHAVAFAPPAALRGRVLDTSWEDFATAQRVSAYSLIEVARETAPLMTGGGSITALSFLGAQRVVPGYNVMGVAKASLEALARQLAAELGGAGIRVNCVSPGPVRTVSARGIRGFADMARRHNDVAPLGRSCDQSEVAETISFLASAGAASITGQTLFVDGGYSCMGGASHSVVDGADGADGANG
jgi:enoyl-[acyl-carrier protein] reductase I